VPGPIAHEVVHFAEVTERGDAGGAIVQLRDTIEALCKAWTEEPSRFMHNPHHQIPGPNI
jgi:hypothetical protein